MTALVTLANGDMRRSINILQVFRGSVFRKQSIFYRYLEVQSLESNQFYRYLEVQSLESKQYF